MLGKLAPLHSTPPGCCISRAALLKLLGCQVAPKLTRTRNAHRLLHSPAAAAALCASEHQDSLWQMQSLLPSPNLHQADLSYNRDLFRSDVQMISWQMHLGSSHLRLYSRPSLWVSHLPITCPRHNVVLETNLCYGLLSSEGLRYPWKWISVVWKKAGQHSVFLPCLARTWQTKLLHQINSCCIKLMLIEMQEWLAYTGLYLMLGEGII